MPASYYVVVTIHGLAAMLWLGGMLFLGAVGAPALRAVEPPALRARLFAEIGARFRGVGWVCIGVLLATGVANLWFRGWLRWPEPAVLQRAFWQTGTGLALALKLAAVALMVANSALHDFVVGPRAGRLPPGSPEAVRVRTRAALMARANALVGIGLVIAAVRLAR